MFSTLSAYVMWNVQIVSYKWVPLGLKAVDNHFRQTLLMFRKYGSSKRQNKSPLFLFRHIHFGHRKASHHSFYSSHSVLFIVPAFSSSGQRIVWCVHSVVIIIRRILRPTLTSGVAMEQN